MAQNIRLESVWWVKVSVDVSETSQPVHSSPAQSESSPPDVINEDSIVPQSKRSAVVIPELKVEALASPKKKSGGVFGFFRRQKPKNGDGSAAESAANKSNSLDKKTAEEDSHVKQKESGPGQSNIQLIYLFIYLL